MRMITHALNDPKACISFVKEGSKMENPTVFHVNQSLIEATI